MTSLKYPSDLPLVQEKDSHRITEVEPSCHCHCCILSGHTNHHHRNCCSFYSETDTHATQANPEFLILFLNLLSAGYQN